MSLRKTLIWVAVVWLVVITLMHGWLSLHLFAAKRATGADQNKFRIGFLPVTCHLTCPVTDSINKRFASRNP
jgi:NitT/TauT family transport system substrate-binding protein